MCENFPLKVIWMKTRSFCMDIFLGPRYACIETGRVLGCGWHLKRWMASGRWSSEVKKRIPMEYLSGFFTTTGTKWYIKQKKKKFQNWDKTKDRKHVRRLHWWLSGIGSACQCRRQGFNPWSSMMPPVMEQLTPSATTTEPMYHNYWSPCIPVLHKRSQHSEKPAHHN